MNKYVVRFLIFIFVFVFSFWLFSSYYRNQRGADKEDLKVKFEGSNEILLNNKLPISDTLGKELTGSGMEKGIQGYLEFSIENPSNEERKYSVLITRGSVENKEIEGDFVRFYLTDDENKSLVGFEKNIVPNYTSLNASASKPASRVLYSGMIGKKETQSFRLRMWVADNYAFTNNIEEFLVHVDVQ